jgi:Tfp pilus assembly protein PilV
MLKNEKGLTLVEVLVAAAIMMVVALAMSNMMFMQGNQQKSLMAKATFNSLVNNVQNAAENPNVLARSAEAMEPAAQGGGTMNSNGNQQ